MLKRLVSYILLLVSTTVYAVRVNENVNINIELDFLSKYIYRGSCLSYENFQSNARFIFGNDTIGTVNIQPFFTFGHDVSNKFYYEVDAILSYTVPGHYLTFGFRYLNYDGLSSREHELQIGAIATLANICPITLIAETTIFNDIFLYDTNILLTYDAIYKQWDFIPSIGFRFGCLNTYGYLQFDAKRNVILSEKAKMFIELSGNVNSIDILNNFTYQKNINGWVTCGFKF